MVELGTRSLYQKRGCRRLSTDGCMRRVSTRHYSKTDGQSYGHRMRCLGITKRVPCRSKVCGVKWEIPD